jgi:hypothetical protein
MIQHWFFRAKENKRRKIKKQKNDEYTFSHQIPSMLDSLPTSVDDLSMPPSVRYSFQKKIEAWDHEGVLKGKIIVKPITPF